MSHETSQNPIEESKIDDLGHILRVGQAVVGEPDYNERIDVFRIANEGDRAQVYQMWAVDKFATNPVAYEAVKAFNLAGAVEGKEGWAQLLEHISGVTAIATHLESLLEKHGAQPVDTSSVEAAALFDNIEKPLAVSVGAHMWEDVILETAALVHDFEKPAEIAAAQEMAKQGNAGGLENSRDNPVLREGRLWRYLHDHGVSDDVILAAQNTGRSDRFFSDLDDYTDSTVKKALQDREALANLLGVDRDAVDTMTPGQRRRASIEAKGRVAALIGISDALAAQFKFQGITDAQIDNMSQYYLSYKKDPESVAFFGRDWPEYYKEVRRYLIDQVPEANREALEADLAAMTHEQVFNETVLPLVLGPSLIQRSRARHVAGQPNTYDKLRYPERHWQQVDMWSEAKADDPEKNEDVMYQDQEVLVLTDGATDKSGVTYTSGKTGGKVLAELASSVAAKSHKVGYELADEVTAAVRDFYSENNPEALSDPSKRAATTLVAARLVGQQLVITQIGDTNVRLTMTDGSRQVFTNDKQVDAENAALRADHIKSALENFVQTHGHQPNEDEQRDIVASGRAVIQDRLNRQYELQNSVEDPRGYGTIDGSEIPRNFSNGQPTEYVKTLVFPATQVAMIELVSDGFYSQFPESAMTADYQELYQRIHREDPDKYQQYLSTKSKDDASVIIASL